MWILNWLPDFVFYALVLAGLAGLVVSTFFLQFVPFLYAYRLPVKVASIAAMLIGVWFSGGIANEELWQARIKEVEAKLAAAEVEAAEENVRIVEKVVVKQKVVKERGEDIVKYVDREVVKYDTKFIPGGACEIPKEFINAHNSAATESTEQLQAK